MRVNDTIPAAELRRLWHAWVSAKVREGVSQDRAETSAHLLTICNLFGLEPEALGIVQGDGGRSLSATTKTVRALISIVLTLIGEHVERPGNGGEPPAWIN